MEIGDRVTDRACACMETFPLKVSECTSLWLNENPTCGGCR